jgi:sugar O-acyltransferase (sialic acid O-acetyltransferase NeuD family)
MPEPLVLLGFGGNNLDILDAITEINTREPTYEVIGYLTPDGSARDTAELPCLGNFTTAKQLASDVLIAGFSFGPGNFHTWPATVDSLGVSTERFATIIHPRAYVSPRSKVGHGTVIMAGTTVGADVTIGNHVTILQNCGLSHDDVIGDYTALTVGVTFSGNVKVGRNCFLGTNSTIIRANIGDGSLVGAHTLIREDVPPGEVWVGVPGRFLRKISR